MSKVRTMQNKVEYSKSQLDYEFLLKLDRWSKKDAALIACGFNPVDYRDVRFSSSGKAVPPGLDVVYKIYQVFCSVDFGTKYQDYKGHPLNYMLECHEKDIAMVAPLREAVKQRVDYMEALAQQGRASSLTKRIHKNIVYVDSGEGARERRYLLKIVGALAKLHFDTKKQKQPGSKQAVSHLVEEVLQLLENNHLRSSGLGKSNLHKKIVTIHQILIMLIHKGREVAFKQMH